MAFPHPIKPEGVSRFTIWLSMCTTFVKFTLLTHFFVLFNFFSFLSYPATTSPFILPPVQAEIFILTKDAFLPSVSACPQLLITAPSLVSIAIRQQKHSALKNRQILVAASHFFFFFSLQQLPPAFTSAEICGCADIHPREWTKKKETAAYGSVS